MIPVIQANGAEIPALGFGTWRMNGSECTRMVREALAAGYRHIDTAQMYGNEEAVGKAIAETQVLREDIFLTSKIWHDRAREGDLQKSVEESLRRLNLPYVDLMLLHWPNLEVPLEQTIRALSQVKADGMARHIGVSNFTTALLDTAVHHATEPLACNQCEYHPYLDQAKVIEATRRHGMAFTAYCPIAHGKVNDEPVLQRIGAAHGKTAVQVTLRWLVQQEGVAAIPKSSSVKRLRENFDIDDFVLSQEEMDEIFDLARPDGRLIDPGWAPEWDQAA